MYSISKPNTHLPVQRQPHISRHARNGTRFLQRLCLEICMPHTRLPSCFSVHVAGWNRITIAPGRRLNPFVCRTLASSVISVQQVWGRYGTWYSVPTDRKAVGIVLGSHVCSNSRMYTGVYTVQGTYIIPVYRYVPGTQYLLCSPQICRSIY